MSRENLLYHKEVTKTRFDNKSLVIKRVPPLDEICSETGADGKKPTARKAPGEEEALPCRRGVQGPALGPLLRSMGKVLVGVQQAKPRKFWGMYKIVSIGAKHLTTPKGY